MAQIRAPKSSLPLTSSNYMSPKKGFPVVEGVNPTIVGVFKPVFCYVATCFVVLLCGSSGTERAFFFLSLKQFLGEIQLNSSSHHYPWKATGLQKWSTASEKQWGETLLPQHALTNNTNARYDRGVKNLVLAGCSMSRIVL